MTPKQDGLEEKKSETIADSSQGDTTAPSPWIAATQDATPDGLKEGGSPFGDEDVFSGNTTETASDAQQPDWIEEAVAPKTAQESTPTSIVEQDEEILSPEKDEVNWVPPQSNIVTAEVSDVPDWLQWTTSDEDNTSQSSPFGEEESTPKDVIHETETPSDVPQQQVSEDVEMLEAPNDSLISATTESMENAKDGETLTTEWVSTTVTDDDIPDWLRGAISPESDTSPTTIAVTEESALPSEEAILPETDMVSSQKKSQKPWKNPKNETITGGIEKNLLNTPENLIEATHDTLLTTPAVPKKKTPATKKITTPKNKPLSSDHLLESEHDMLLPPTTEDTTP